MQLASAAETTTRLAGQGASMSASVYTTLGIAGATNRPEVPERHAH